MKRRDFKPLSADTFRSLGNQSHRSAMDWFSSWLVLAACALSMGAREQEYLDEAKRWNQDQLATMSQLLGQYIESAERDPYLDILGPIYMDLTISKAGNGEFYTPPELCKLIARMNLRDLPEHRPITFLEPSVGSGGMVLAAVDAMVFEHGLSPFDLRATCVDVSRRACDMTYIQLAAHAIPAVVIHGNSLSLEQWGAWATPWWHSRYRCAALIDKIGSGVAIHSEPESKPEPVPTIQTVAQATATGQFVFDLSEVAS